MTQRNIKSLSDARPERQSADPARRDPAQRQRRSADRVPLPEIPNGEMTPRVQSAVMGLMEELDQLKDQLSAANERVSELESMADEDPLVPVLNRRGFVRELERTLAYAKRYGTTASLVFIDLDDFKSINDRHGHAVGDAALRHVAEFLLANVRRSDIVGRLGGDEFAIVLHRADASAAENKAFQLAGAIIAQPLVYGEFEIALDLSVGITELDEADTVSEALERADRAMYRHKARRKAASE
ncbi:MAG: GGDEF domain-containing protein [Methyloligellaceae bacterium]